MLVARDKTDAHNLCPTQQAVAVVHLDDNAFQVPVGLRRGAKRRRRAFPSSTMESMAGPRSCMQLNRLTAFRLYVAFEGKRLLSIQRGGRRDGNGSTRRKEKKERSQTTRLTTTFWCSVGVGQRERESRTRARHAHPPPSPSPRPPVPDHRDAAPRRLAADAAVHTRACCCRHGLDGLFARSHRPFHVYIRGARRVRHVWSERHCAFAKNASYAHK